MTNTVIFALKALGREARAGELKILFAAIVVAVAAITAVAFFTSRVSDVFMQQADEVLAADLRLESGRPLDGNNRYTGQAQRLGLRIAHTVSFSTVLFNGENSQLTNIVGVSDRYPLRGALRIATDLEGVGVPTTALPQPGEAWADTRILSQLRVPLGASIHVGSLSVKITRVLAYRPDQGAMFSVLAPTLLLAENDIPNTHLLLEGSRATWTLLYAGAAPEISEFKAWLRNNKSAAERLVVVSESNAQLQKTLESSTRFLQLASLSTLLLAAIAVALTARRYSQRQMSTIALMKSLGASQWFVLRVTALQLFMTAFAGAAVGIGFGWVAQNALVWLLQDLIPNSIPPARLAIAGLGLAVALITLLGFALPPLLRLRNTPPARVLRETMEPAPLSNVANYSLPLLAFSGVSYLLVRDWMLIGYALCGLLIVAVIFGLAGALVVRVTAGVRGVAGVAWRYGISNIGRRGGESIVHIAAFGLGFTALLLLSVVRGELLNDWQHSFPSDTPNHFLFNISEIQIKPLNQLLASSRVVLPTYMPWVRARLVAINGVTMQKRPRELTERGRAFVEREQNLSWSLKLPQDNQVTAGEWWNEHSPSFPQVSVATEFKDELGLQLNDVLTFDVAGEIVNAPVTSIRKVRWDGFRPNFFLVFPPRVLDAMTGTFVTSLFVSQEGRKTLSQVARSFPNITVLDVGKIIDQIRVLMERAALAVQYVFVFTVLAGVMVLLSALEGSRDARLYEAAIVRALGASRRTLLTAVAVEFSVIGALAGLLASSAAAVAGWLIATKLLGIAYHFSGTLWIYGAGGGGLVVGLIGLLATRSVVSSPPSMALRDH